jgi:hypothetical protein
MNLVRSYTRISTLPARSMRRYPIVITMGRTILRAITMEAREHVQLNHLFLI